MNFPLITICLSCYNAEDTIENAIQGAFAQNWPNKEFVIVDDCSTDSSIDVIKKIIKGRDDVRLIEHSKNLGFAGALNTLISEAKGEFIAIFDDDDISTPDRVHLQYDRITQYEEKFQVKLVVCHSARIQKFPNGDEYYEPTMGVDQSRKAPAGLDVVDRILTGRLSSGVVGSCANCSRMARVEVFKHIDGYDESMRRSQDTDFNIRLGHAGGHFAGIAEPLVIQAMTMGSEKSLDTLKAAERAILNKNKNYLMQKHWYNFCIEWLDIRYEYLNDKKWNMCKKLFFLFARHPIKVIYKIYWALPARSTRKSFKNWYNKS